MNLTVGHFVCRAVPLDLGVVKAGVTREWNGMEWNNCKGPTEIMKSNCLTLSGLIKVKAYYWGHCLNASWTQGNQSLHSKACSVKDFFPNDHSEPPLAQLCAIPSRSITGYQGEEPIPPFPFQLPRKLQRAIRFMLSLFSRLKNPSVLTGHAFQPFYQLCCPPLDTILCILWSPEL